jgi:polysaccharide export outer membrane protein
MAMLVRRVLLSTLMVGSCVGAPMLSAAQTGTDPRIQPSETAEIKQPTPSLLSTSSQDAPVQRTAIKISAGDLILVTVDGVSDYKPEARVSEDGVVSLPLIGEVTIGGFTVEQAQNEIAKRMSDGNYFRDPHVSVFVKEYVSIGISVLGEVARPGVYPSLGVRRLYDVISAAGGFSARAGKTVTITHRDLPQKPITITIDADPAKSVSSNVEVQPGDTIMVSKAGLVYVVGDVGRAGGFIMDNNERITVLQVLAMAQGVNRSAAMGSARIIRRTPQGPSEVQVPLKQMMAAKANDMEMQPEDILFIPGSAAKNVVKRSMESVMQVATSLAIYGPH